MVIRIICPRYKNPIEILVSPDFNVNKRVKCYCEKHPLEIEIISVDNNEDQMK